MKRFVNILAWILAIFWMGFASLSLIYLLAAGRSPDGPELFGYRFMMVLSDSMAPEVRTGDLVVGRKPTPQTIEPGQIITYRSRTQSRLVTHRVVEVLKEGRQLAFITKGDANDLPDLTPVNGYDVTATYLFRVPFVGYAVSFARSWYGFVLMVLVPGLLFMGSEAMRVVRLLKLQGDQVRVE